MDHDLTHGLDVAPTWSDFWSGWELFREPVLCAVAAGAVLGFLSVYVVLRRMVFVSAVTTQSAGLGVALAFYLQIHHGTHVDPRIGAVVLALAAALFLVMDPRRVGLSHGAMLGLVFALAGGAAVAVGSCISQEAHEIENILFGSAVIVSTRDLYLMIATATVLLAGHLWWFRGISFASFDPVTARVHRMPVRILDGVLFASIGIAVGVATQALGALPVFAMTTLPGIAALLVCRGPLIWPFVVAAVFGASAGFFGYVVSFFRDLPVGACQTLVAAGIVILAVPFRPLGAKGARR